MGSSDFRKMGPPSLTGRVLGGGCRTAPAVLAALSEATTGAAQAAARNARRVGRLVIRGLRSRDHTSQSEHLDIAVLTARTMSSRTLSNNCAPSTRQKVERS